MQLILEGSRRSEESSRSLEEGRRKERADSLMKRIQRAREGKSRFTLVKDSFGNSTIMSEKAMKRRISVRDAQGLTPGEQRIAARKMRQIVFIQTNTFPHA
jgi:C4-type Zn-finger protein